MATPRISSGPTITSRAGRRPRCCTILAGKPDAVSAKFKDVNYSEYYGPAISWARATGVISGYGETNTFGPNDYVTREQFATMLANYASKVAGIDVTPSGEKARAMTDYAAVSPFAVPAVEWVMGSRCHHRRRPRGRRRAHPP